MNGVRFLIGWVIISAVSIGFIWWLGRTIRDYLNQKYINE